MRAIWTLAVACLLAASGVQPAHAAELREVPGHAERIAAALDRHPALPALISARSSALVVAARPAAAVLPLAVLVAPPVLGRPTIRATALAPHRALAPGSASVPTRSARGPPAR